jgi:Cys-tRNA(Pro) deacylase
METPTTPATRVLDEAGVAYRLVHHGVVSSAEEAAERRGIRLEQLAKTLVVRVEEGSYVLVLIPGDQGMDYKRLRSHLGINRLTMPSPEEALEATGYARGTITPLGAGGWPVLIDEALAHHDEISLGAGIPEWAIHLHPTDLMAVTGATLASLTN